MQVIDVKTEGHRVVAARAVLGQPVSPTTASNRIFLAATDIRRLDAGTKDRRDDREWNASDALGGSVES
jgi:hypothetical protein